MKNIANYIYWTMLLRSFIYVIRSKYPKKCAKTYFPASWLRHRSAEGFIVTASGKQQAVRLAASVTH